MRTKRSAKGRFHRPSLRSDSATASRPLPPPVTDDISDDNDDSVDSIELQSSSESDDSTSDSSSSSDDLGEKTCLKCEKGGELLCCSGIGCSIALHKECIVGQPRYNEEKFHCPYCWFKLQESKREEWRIKVMLAKKDLTAFINFQPQMACGSDNEEENMNVGETINETNHFENSDTKTKAANKPQGERENLEKEEETNEKTTAADVPEVLDSETKSYIARLRRTKQINCQKMVGSPFGHGKRKRVLWTLEEEEMLREGMQKFSTTANQTIPWRKILEFGSHVFDPSRNPGDLKDKWRNISSKKS